jgi:hypothetical protein
LLSLTKVALEADPATVLATIPAGPGVAQILGPEGRNLLIGRPANLRRWFATHLGQKPGKPKPGKRPPTDLRPIAVGLAYAPVATPFEQRLRYERLMARYVPASARRDLKPPAFVHVDLGERFPRLTVRRAEGDLGGLFGPFRDRGAAERARTGLHKLLPLRPCDYTFEPDPDLPLGLGCLYAQVRTCAAPCLARASEADYRALAAAAVRILGGDERPEGALAWLPPWISAARGQRGIVAATAAGTVHLFPVRQGTVLEDQAGTVPLAELEAGAARLRWDPPADPPDDWAWLTAWLHAPRKNEAYVLLKDDEEAEAAAARVRGMTPALVNPGRGRRAVIT